MPAVNHLPNRAAVAELCRVPKSELKAGAIPKDAKMSMLSSSKGHDLFISTKRQQLKEAMKDLKNCKRENYATEEEYLAAKDRYNARVQKLQEELQDGDERFTDFDTKNDILKIGAFGDFFKKGIDAISGLVRSVGEALKGLGKDALAWLGGLFGKA